MIIKGRFIYRGELIDGYIKLSQDGYIAEVSKDISAGEKVDYKFDDPGTIIFPGFIDIHVHMRDFSQDYKEDFYTGTSSAAAGGITLIIDMPNTEPRNNRLSILEYRDSVANNKAVVDYGLNYGVPPSLDDLFGYESIAIGMKFYPTDFKEYSLDHLSDILIYNYAKGVVTVFHAEEPDGYLRGDRDESLEIEASRYIAGYTDTIGVKTHITHVTNGEVVDIVKAINGKVSFDVTPHHLILSSDDVKPPYGNVRPPLRSRTVRDTLLKYLSNGKIDIYATDHAPHTEEEKSEGENGFPGLETSVAILTTLYHKGFISIQDMVKLYSINPAKLYGLDSLYGYIEPGYIGNFTVVNLKEEWIVDPSKFFTKAKHSPFEGRRVRGRVVSTFIRGVQVYNGDDIQVKRGFGFNIVKRFMRR